MIADTLDREQFGYFTATLYAVSFMDVACQCIGLLAAFNCGKLCEVACKNKKSSPVSFISTGGLLLHQDKHEDFHVFAAGLPAVLH